MPTINIPPKLRFALYLVGVVGAVLVQYAIDKAWFGEAEMRLWSGIAAVLFALALAKTNLSDNGVLLEGTVEQTGPGTADVTIHAPDESTQPPRPILGKAFVSQFSKAAEDERRDGRA